MRGNEAGVAVCVLRALKQAEVAFCVGGNVLQRSPGTAGGVKALLSRRCDTGKGLIEILKFNLILQPKIKRYVAVRVDVLVALLVRFTGLHLDWQPLLLPFVWDAFAISKSLLPVVLFLRKLVANGLFVVKTVPTACPNVAMLVSRCWRSGCRAELGGL